MNNILKKTICCLTLLTFMFSSFGPLPSARAQAVSLPPPGEMVGVSAVFNPTVLRGVTVHPENPFLFDFIVDQGQPSDALQEESTRLIRYFLASLTIPEDDLWVNLSPYEKDRIIPDEFGLTEMGRDLLAQDYILKQLASTLLYPDGEVGKAFWAEVYRQAFEKYGTTDVPIDTFHKVWIMPDVAKVFEKSAEDPSQGMTAFLVEAKMKVMLESDYVAEQAGAGHPAPGTGTEDPNASHETREISKRIMREVVLPIIEREVNEGANFAKVRQVYYSLVLASWFKKRMKESLLGQKYVDHRQTSGVNIDDPNEKMAIYERYVESLKKGVFNFIREDDDPLTHEPIPRKYFSGGMQLKVDPASATEAETRAVLPSVVDHAMNVRVRLATSDMSVQEGGDEALSLPAGLASGNPFDLIFSQSGALSDDKKSHLGRLAGHLETLMADLAGPFAGLARELGVQDVRSFGRKLATNYIQIDTKRGENVLSTIQGRYESEGRTGETPEMFQARRILEILAGAYHSFSPSEQQDHYTRLALEGKQPLIAVMNLQGLSGFLKKKLDLGAGTPLDKAVLKAAYYSTKHSQVLAALIKKLDEDTDIARESDAIKAQYLTAIYAVAVQGAAGYRAFAGIIEDLKASGIKWADMGEALKKQYLISVYKTAIKGYAGRVAFQQVMEGFKAEQILWSKMDEAGQKQYLTAVYNVAMQGEEGVQAFRKVMEDLKAVGIRWTELDPNSQKQYLIAVYSVAKLGGSLQEFLDVLRGRDIRPWLPVLWRAIVLRKKANFIDGLLGRVSGLGEEEAAEVLNTERMRMDADIFNRSLGPDSAMMAGPGWLSMPGIEQIRSGARYALDMGRGSVMTFHVQEDDHGGYMSVERDKDGQYRLSLLEEPYFSFKLAPDEVRELPGWQLRAKVNEQGLIEFTRSGQAGIDTILRQEVSYPLRPGTDVLEITFMNSKGKTATIYARKAQDGRLALSSERAGQDFFNPGQRGESALLIYQGLSVGIMNWDGERIGIANEGPSQISCQVTSLQLPVNEALRYMGRLQKMADEDPDGNAGAVALQDLEQAKLIFGAAVFGAEAKFDPDKVAGAIANSEKDVLSIGDALGYVNAYEARDRGERTGAWRRIIDNVVKAQPETVGKDFAQSVLSPEVAEWNLFDLPASHYRALMDNLDVIYKIDRRLSPLNDRFNVLERYSFVQDILLNRNWEPEQFGMELASDFGKSLSDLNLYLEAAGRGLVDPDKVTSVLDLGVGTWSNAHVLPDAFPNMKHVLGIEIRPDARENFRMMASYFNLDPQHYSFETGDFRTLPSSGILEQYAASQGQFDLVLLQNPQVSMSAMAYRKLLRHAARNMSEDGKLMIVMDVQRQGYDGNPELMDALGQALGQSFDDNRITQQDGPDGRGRPVTVIVVPASELRAIPDEDPVVTRESYPDDRARTGSQAGTERYRPGQPKFWQRSRKWVSAGIVAGLVGVKLAPMLQEGPPQSLSEAVSIMLTTGPTAAQVKNVLHLANGIGGADKDMLKWPNVPVPAGFVPGMESPIQPSDLKVYRYDGEWPTALSREGADAAMVVPDGLKGEIDPAVDVEGVNDWVVTRGWDDGLGEQVIAPQVESYVPLGRPSSEKVEEIVGIRNKALIRLPDGRSIFIADDHSNVFSFWWLMRQDKKLGEAGNRLLHIDAHPDAEISRRYKTAPNVLQTGIRKLLEIERYAQNVLGIQGFITPLVDDGFIARDQWYWLYNLDTLKAVRMVDGGEYRYQSDGNPVIDPDQLEFDLLDIDIDALGGYPPEKAEMILDRFARLAVKAKAISIVTSPSFIDQRLAFDYTRRLVSKIAKLRASAGDKAMAGIGLMASYADTPFWYRRIVSPETHDHLLRIREKINPDGRPLTAIYVGSGPDVLTEFQATGAKENVMVGRERFDLEEFARYIEGDAWEEVGSPGPKEMVSQKKRMFDKGFIDEGYIKTQEDFSDFLILGLKAMGVQRSEVGFGKDADKGDYLAVTRQWPGTRDVQEARFYFVQVDDMTRPETYTPRLQYFISQGFNVVLQKAGMSVLVEKYATWLPMIARQVRSGGFIAVEGVDSPAQDQVDPVAILRGQGLAVEQLDIPAMPEAYGRMNILIRKFDAAMNNYGEPAENKFLQYVSLVLLGVVLWASWDIWWPTAKAVRGRMLERLESFDAWKVKLDGNVDTVLNGLVDYSFANGMTTLYLEKDKARSQAIAEDLLNKFGSDPKRREEIVRFMTDKQLKVPELPRGSDRAMGAGKIDPANKRDIARRYLEMFPDKTRPRIMRDEVFVYNTAINELIAPQGGGTVVLGAGGTDLANALAITNGSEFYVLDQQGISPRNLQAMWDFMWDKNISDHEYVSFKYENGFGHIRTITDESAVAIALIAELQVLGLEKDDVSVDSEDGMPVVRFMKTVAGREMVRSFYFVKVADLADPRTWPREFVNKVRGRADIYLQNAAMKLPKQLKKYAKAVDVLLKDGGYCVVDPFLDYKKPGKVNVARSLRSAFAAAEVPLETTYSDLIKRAGLEYGVQKEIVRKGDAAMGAGRAAQQVRKDFLTFENILEGSALFKEITGAYPGRVKIVEGIGRTGELTEKIIKATRGLSASDAVALSATVQLTEDRRFDRWRHVILVGPAQNFQKVSKIPEVLRGVSREEVRHIMLGGSTPYDFILVFNEDREVRFPHREISRTAKGEIEYVNFMTSAQNVHLKFVYSKVRGKMKDVFKRVGKDVRENFKPYVFTTVPFHPSTKKFADHFPPVAGALQHPHDLGLIKLYAAVVNEDNEKLAKDVAVRQVDQAMGAVNRERGNKDMAMDAPGGIDFTADGVDLQVGSQGAPINFGDPAQWQNVQINGLYPVVLNISPVRNLVQLLGL